MFETPQSTNLVRELHKALYGLKQAPIAWFDKLYGALYDLDFGPQNLISPSSSR